MGPEFHFEISVRQAESNWFKKTNKKHLNKHIIFLVYIDGR